MQSSAVRTDQYEQMSPLEGHRAYAVRREAKECARRPDRAVLPVVHDPQSHGPFPGSGAKEAPADDEIAPPQSNPKTENTACVGQPDVVRDSSREIIDPSSRSAPVELPAHRYGEEGAKTAVQNHVDEGGRTPPSGAGGYPSLI